MDPCGILEMQKRNRRQQKWYVYAFKYKKAHEREEGPTQTQE